MIDLLVEDKNILLQELVLGITIPQQIDSCELVLDQLESPSRFHWYSNNGYSYKGCNIVKAVEDRLNSIKKDYDLHHMTEKRIDRLYARCYSINQRYHAEQQKRFQEV